MKRFSVMFFLSVMSMSMTGCRAVARHGDDVVRFIENGGRIKDLIELILGKDDEEDTPATVLNVPDVQTLPTLQTVPTKPTFQTPPQTSPTAIKAVDLQYRKNFQQEIEKRPLSKVSAVPKVPVKCVYCNGTGKRGALQCTHCHGSGIVR